MFVTGGTSLRPDSQLFVISKCNNFPRFISACCTPHIVVSKMGQPQEYLKTDFETWARSDRYHNERLIPTDEVLDHVLHTSASLPNIAVSKAQVR